MMNEKRKKRKGGVKAPPHPLRVVADVIDVTGEEKVDTPKPRNRDNGVNDSCENASRTARDPCHSIEAEKADKTPVHTTDDSKHEGDFVDDHHHIFPSLMPSGSSLGHTRPYSFAPFCQ